MPRYAAPAPGARVRPPSPQSTGAHPTQGSQPRALGSRDPKQCFSLKASLECPSRGWFSGLSSLTSSKNSKAGYFSSLLSLWSQQQTKQQRARALSNPTGYIKHLCYGRNENPGSTSALDNTELSGQGGVGGGSGGDSVPTQEAHTSWSQVDQGQTQALTGQAPGSLLALPVSGRSCES